MYKKIENLQKLIDTITLNEKELKGEVFVLSPPTSLGISRTCNDVKELKRVYEIGRRVALEKSL